MDEHLKLQLHYQKYNIDIAIVTAPGSITNQSAETTFYNLGTAIAVVKGLPLQTGQQLIINGNNNELDVTQWYIAFTGGGTQQLAVIRKLYC